MGKFCTFSPLIFSNTFAYYIDPQGNLFTFSCREMTYYDYILFPIFVNLLLMTTFKKLRLTLLKKECNRIFPLIYGMPTVDSHYRQWLKL